MTPSSPSVCECCEEPITGPEYVHPEEGISLCERCLAELPKEGEDE